jgi:surface protein
MVGIYPFLGGNNTLNQLNLKESSLTVYPASFTGSWSSSFSGSRNNTTASYATLTGLTPSTYHPLVNTQSFHMAYLSYDTPATSGSLMGAITLPASGGLVTISGSRVYHAFKTTGTSSFTPLATRLTNVEVMVVAGGGAGGGNAGGGGGAGGLIYSSSFSIAGTGSVQVIVGSGGSPLSGATGNGENSRFGTIVSTGGGRGGEDATGRGKDGGSGGGQGLGGDIGSGSLGQGNNGGYRTGLYGAGGGGGAGQSGSNGIDSNIGGPGGSGSFYGQFTSIGGSPAGWFAGGGGGGGNSGFGAGGIGGGGAGVFATGSSGSVNTGGGGGAGGLYFNFNGGAGGSGIVIVAYDLPTTPLTGSGTVLYTDGTSIGGAVNTEIPSTFSAGGPLGLVMTSRTGSRAYSVSKNKVIFNYTSSASSSISNNLLLNAVNLNGTASFPSQNNVAYASVGAGLTDSETRTYYDLVDTFQTNLGKVKSTNPDAFITLWDTRLTGSGTSNSSSIVLPLYGTQAITASWGDGTTSIISSSAQADRTHSYATPGIYTVTITGSGEGFRFDNSGDKTKLLDIGQWGTTKLGHSSTGFSTGFYGCVNLIGTAPDAPTITNPGMLYCFNGASKFNGYINNWNMGSVTTLSGMFQSANSFNQTLNNWNVSNVTNMSDMFTNNTAFNGEISNWNVSKVTGFDFSFYGASKFNNNNKSGIGNWQINTSSLVSMGYMFAASAFDQNIGAWNMRNVAGISTYGPLKLMFYQSQFNNGGSPDINNWRFNTSSDIAMTSMFQENTRFNQPIGSWNIEKVTDMSSMFQSATAFNNSGSNTINNWRPISCSNFSSMFSSATTFNQPIGNWPLSASSVNMSNMFNNADAFNQNIGAWNVEKVTNMTSMFQNNGGFNNSGSSDINNWRPISCSNFTSMFQSATAFNQPIGNWPISASGVNMSSMFQSANSFNQNIGAWNVSNVTNFSSMFLGTNFNNGNSSNINNWTIGTTNPITMASMFNQCSFNQNISNWNTSAVTSMQGMFTSATQFNQPIGVWNTSNVTNMANMFQQGFGGHAFNQDIGNWNVSNVTNFSGFMDGKTTYSYLHTIYDGWINYKLQPQRTISFGSIKYSGSAAEGRALLSRTYNTASITGYSNDGGFTAITCSVSHSVIVGNKVFISGSSYSGINGVQTVLVAGSPTTLTLNTVYDPTATGGTAITGYGWSITDGGVV